MSSEARKVDSNCRRLLTAGASLAPLGAVGLDPVVQQAQTAAAATAGKKPAEEEPERRTYPRAPEFRKRFGPRRVLQASKTKAEADPGASCAINQAMGKVRKADA